MNFNFQTIGYIRSPYKEKFAIPRQPNLIKNGNGELHLIDPFNDPLIIKGLEQFSYIWLLFIFDKTMDKPWHPTVRPPRLGGNKRIGVFATRSTFRPNPIGLSSVKLKDIIVEPGKIILKLGSVDLVDNTPIIDIKPYIPYSDSHADAIAGFAQQKPLELLNVEFSLLALEQLKPITTEYPTIKALIEEVIAQDPRPAYHANSDKNREYGISLYEYNIRFNIIGDQATVLEITV